MARRSQQSRRKPAETEQAPYQGWPWFLALYLCLGLASALIWTRVTDSARLPSWHAEMIGGYAPAPNQYRPLTPWLAELVRALVPDGSLYTAYLALRALATGMALFCFDRYLRLWFHPAAAAAGALGLAAALPFTYFRVVQESDPLNLLIFVLGFWALGRGRDLWLAPLVAVGTLNRETVAMLPAVYLLARWGRLPPRALALRTAAIGAPWVIVYGLMRSPLGYGPRPYYCDVVMLGQNLASVAPTLHVALLFGALWVLAFLAWRQGPELPRRALWLVPPYVLLHYVVAMVIEVRLFLPLAPIIVPLAWWALFPEARLAQRATSQTPL